MWLAVPSQRSRRSWALCRFAESDPQKETARRDCPCGFFLSFTKDEKLAFLCNTIKDIFYLKKPLFPLYKSIGLWYNCNIEINF